MKQGWTYKKLNEVCDKGSSNIVINKLEDNNGDYPLFGASGLVKNVDFYHQDKPYIGIVKDGAGVGRVNTYPAFSSLVGTMQYIFAKENCLLDFIKYFLIKLDLSHCVSGATIPHIYFKDYGKERIPVPSIEVQKSIVAELDKINEVISLKKAQLGDLDALAQSLFYDMFGDPIENEKGWDVKKLSDNVHQMFLGPFGSALKTDCYVPEDVSYAMVYEQKHAIRGSLNQENHFIDKDKFDSLSRFEVLPGDFIMSCRGTIGKIYQIPDGAPKGIIHPSLMKIRIKDAYNPKFFEFLLPKIIATTQTNGNCVQMAITASNLGKMNFVLPPLSLQQTFAKRIEAIEQHKQYISSTIRDLETLLASRMQYWFD